MRHMGSFLIAVLLTVVVAAGAFAWQTGAPARTCEQGTNTLTQEPLGGQALDAIISKIDRQTGLVDLQTEEGRLQMYVSPKDLTDLQEGDRVTVYIADDEEPLGELT